MTALSYLYVVFGAAFIVAATLVVRISAPSDGPPLEVTEEHERTLALDSHWRRGTAHGSKRAMKEKKAQLRGSIVAPDGSGANPRGVDDANV